MKSQENHIKNGNDKMALLNAVYSLHKNESKNRFLFLFYEIPYWIVVGKFGKYLLECMTIYDTIDRIICEANMSKFANKFGQNKINEVVMKMYHKLENDGVLKSVKHTRVQTFTEEISSIGINITNGCNLRCKYCYVDAHYQKSESVKLSNTFDNIEKYLKGARGFASVNCYLQLTGGEPLIEKELLFETLDLAEHLNYPNITINSNGILLTNELAALLKNYKIIKNITISLDGNSDIHDLFRGTGSYDEAVKAIDFLVNNGISVTASMTVHGDNIEYLPSFINFCSTKNIMAFTNPVFPIGRCATSSGIKPLDIYEFFKICMEFYRTKAFKTKDLSGTFLSTILVPLRDLKSKHYCGVGLSSTFLNVDGNIYPCANTIGIDYFLCGNIQKDAFEDIWLRSPKYNELRHNIDVDTNEDCKECELKYICAGFCRGMNYQVTEQINTKSIWCYELKKTILDAFWAIDEFPELFRNSKDTFI